MKEATARKRIEGLKQLQLSCEDDSSAFLFPCPRCGHERMKREAVKNAISRHADVYICSECGTEEALLDAAGAPALPLADWAMVCGEDEEDEGVV